MIARRLAFLLLIALTAYAHWALASLGFSIQLDNAKAAGFAWRTFLAQPQAFAALTLQLGSALGLYGLYFWLVASLSRPNPSKAASVGATRAATTLVATWAALSWLVLRLNEHWFPRSVWSWAGEPLTQQAVAPAIDVICSVWILWRISQRITARVHALGMRPAVLSRRATTVAVIIAGIVLYGFAAPHSILEPARGRPDSIPSRPNVIVIGLDSLRRDFALSEDPTQMPALQELRRNSYVQRNVVSPLARTFPAWGTMLTGKSPRDTGIRGNLVVTKDAGKQSVAWKFLAHGYRTIYATDETRFSNIGPEFGFDQIISPLPGVADFMLGQFGDQPLINLAVQIPGSELFLPSLSGNRAFAQAYRPSRFIDRLETAIGPADEQPVLMAIHLCLAHWPYYSALDADFDTSYERATQQLDEQLDQLRQTLHSLGYLNENSILVLLADHGEGLKDELQQLQIKQVQHGTDQTVAQRLGGHGGSLLSASQWQVFLMVSGKSVAGPIPSGTSDQLLSLSDLPTALEQLAGIQTVTPNSGLLMDVVNAAMHLNPSIEHRATIDIETGFSPKDLNLTNPEGGAALRIAESTYDFGNDGRLLMKPAVLEQALDLKDYGVTDGRRVLAVVQREMGPLLVFADGSQWDVYPIDRRPAGVEKPPLLDAACQNPDMRHRLEVWCRSKRSAPSDSVMLNNKIDATQRNKS